MKTLESILNFELGQKVKINPTNHGYTYITQLEKVAARCGKVISIEELIDIDEDLMQIKRRSGRIGVRWEGDYFTKMYCYKRLVIVI